MSNKTGFLNPLLSVQLKRQLKHDLDIGEITMPNMIMDFIEQGYKVTFKIIDSIDAVSVNVTTEVSNSGNSEWILSEYHDTAEIALARAWAYTFMECAECPWLEGNCSTKLFNR